MHKRQFTVVIERDEDGLLVATVPSIQGCHTQAKTMNTLLQRIKEAICLCLEVNRSQISRREFVGLQEIEVGA